MVKIKEHLKFTSIYTFFAAFPALLQLIVYPLIEGNNKLGPRQFGFLGITETIIALVALFCLFGMGAGITRFYYDYNDTKKNYNKLVSTSLNGILFRGLLLMGIAIVLSPLINKLLTQPELKNFQIYGPYLVISGFSRAILAFVIALFRQEKRLKAFVIISLFSGLFRSGFQLIGVSFWDMSFLGYVYGTAVGSGVITLFTIIYLYYKCGFHYDKDIRKQLFPFASSIIFSDLVFWCLAYADRYFLLNQPENLGIYDNAMKFAIGIQFILQGFTGSMQPDLFSRLKIGIKHTEQEVKQLLNLYMAESILVIVGCILPAMYFIHIFYQTKLILSASIIAIVFVKFIFTAQYNIFSLLILYSKKTNFIFYINIFVLIINVVLNFILTPYFGYYGAIISFFCSSIFQVIVSKYIQEKVIKISWNNIKVYYLPFGIILLAVILELLKIKTGGNMFLFAFILVFVSATSMFILYRNEISGLIIKLLKSNTNVFKNIKK